MTKAPVHVVRLGLIKGSIWENQSKGNRHFSVTFKRLFKNGQQWQESTRFARDDLLVVAKVADLAHTWIHETSRRKSKANEDGNGPPPENDL